MSTLTDEKVREIAKDVAKANKVNVANVVLTSATDSTGAPAIEIKLILTPGSSGTIMGERSARTVSEVIQKISDAGEERLPIVRYEEKAGSPSS